MGPPNCKPEWVKHMQAQLKNAAMTTGIVLLTIFVLRKITFTSDIVNKALNG